MSTKILLEVQLDMKNILKKVFLWKFASRRRILSRKVKAALVEEVNGVTHSQSGNTPITKSEYKLFSEMCHFVTDVLRF